MPAIEMSHAFLPESSTMPSLLEPSIQNVASHLIFFNLGEWRHLPMQIQERLMELVQPGSITAHYLLHVV